MLGTDNKSLFELYYLLILSTYNAKLEQYLHGFCIKFGKLTEIVRLAFFSFLNKSGQSKGSHKSKEHEIAFFDTFNNGLTKSCIEP